MSNSRNYAVSKGKAVLWHILYTMLLLVTIVFLFAACGGEEKEPLRAPTEGSSTVAIETVYGTLEFPEDLSANMRHVEATEGDIAMEVFYMLGTNGERELFRIHYADAQVGIHLGYLNTDNGEIPVTYSICEYSDEDFADEEDKKLYYSMMDAFSVIMNSIYADERFSETRAVEPVGTQEVKLRYWTVTLPDNVLFEETVDGDTYRVDLYGEVSGERIDLYFIGLGDMEAETILGMFTADGVQKPVAVETHSLDGYEGWPEEERTVIYQMMESVNDVIQVIVSDKNFSELDPAA